MERSYQLCMMQNARIVPVISICMRSVSETCLVTALTDQNTIFGNDCKIQQKCQLQLQQGQEYKPPPLTNGEKKSELQWNINCITYVQGIPSPHPPHGILKVQLYQQTYSLKGLIYTV